MVCRGVITHTFSMSMSSAVGKSGGGGERWQEEVRCRGQEVEGGGDGGEEGIGGRMETKETGLWLLQRRMKILHQLGKKRVWC